jgi:hypothetical protein
MSPPNTTAYAPVTELTDQIRASIAVNLVMMGSRPILPDIGLEATPEQVSEAVLELALQLVSKHQELPDP